MPARDREAAALQGRESGAGETSEAARRPEPLSAGPLLAVANGCLLVSCLLCASAFREYEMDWAEVCPVVGPREAGALVALWH